jgi:aminoglycoside 2'-N-acetyltransferase I
VRPQARSDATVLRVAHTADLTERDLGSARALLFDVFDDMTEDDWEHSLGGLHAIAWEDGEIVGHASVVMRRLVHQGRALRTGYVEGFGVREDRRGRGHGALLMDALERVIRDAYELGALAASDEAVSFYLHRGWTRWRGTSHAMTPDGLIRTPQDDDAVFVLPVSVTLDVTGAIACDWRGGDCW